MKKDARGRGQEETDQGRAYFFTFEGDPEGGRDVFSPAVFPPSMSIRGCRTL